MHETPLNINTDTLISGSYKPQSQDFPAWTEANFTHTQGYKILVSSSNNKAH